MNIIDGKPVLDVAISSENIDALRAKVALFDVLAARAETGGKAASACAAASGGGAHSPRSISACTIRTYLATALLSRPICRPTSREFRSHANQRK